MIATALSFIGGNWRSILPIGAIALLGLGLILAKMDATHWRKKYDNQVKLEQLAEATRFAVKAQDEAQFAKALADATNDYATRLADRQPLIIRSKDTVTQYAQTPDGKLPCLAADRVRAIEDYDRALGDSTAARTGVEAVRDPLTIQPKQRVHD